MKLINVNEVKVPENRQRRTFDESKLKALVDSIREHGLINPIVLNDDGTLLAGERRLRAVKQLNSPYNSAGLAASATEIAVTYRSELSPNQRYALELAENIDREDLSWQEKAAAIAKLHEFRSAQNPSQTIEATREEARVGMPTISASLKLAPYLDDPEIAKAKDTKEAVKILRKREEARHHQVLAKQFDMDKSEQKLFQTNCYDWMCNAEPAQFDCIITDPPYGIGADKFGDQAEGRHDYDDSLEQYTTFLEHFGPAVYKLAKPDSFLYCFCAIEKWQELNISFTLDGWKVWPRPLIWNKLNTGIVPVPERGPRYSYEAILFAYKGEARVIKQAMPDVISVRPPKQLLHPAQKPVLVYTDLLSRVCRPGSRILDPFAGSGTILPAANYLKLHAVALEQNPTAYAQALTRIASKEIYEDTEEIRL